jgi:hypothetical protein
MRLKTLLVSLTSALLTLPVAGRAQMAETQVDLEYQVEAARQLMDKERRIVFAAELLLTPEEREGFWPIYNEYAKEIGQVADLRVQFITDYAANYDTMTDERADRLLKSFFDYNEKLVKTRRKYLRRYKKVLPTTKVARFYQVENKLDAILNFNLAAQIPLVQDAKAAD